MELDGRLPSTVGRTDETTKLDDVARAGRLQRDQGRIDSVTGQRRVNMHKEST